MQQKPRILNFPSTMLVAAAFAVLLIGVFGIYVFSEKSIDRANERRYQSMLLANELRQSSDDLTRMVRTYLETGNPVYKQHYQDILDIRNGIKPRPANYQGIDWDLVDLQPATAAAGEGTPVALLARMEQAGFSRDELNKVTLAKNNSDTLANLERSAMALMESAPGNLDRRGQASRLLHDQQYHQAKAAIMAPIAEFYTLLDYRTLEAVHRAESQALLLRMVFVICSMCLLLALWRSQRALRATLGAPASVIHRHISQLGQGNFSAPIPVPPGYDSSVMGSLALTQERLRDLEQKHVESERKLTTLARLYAALSECNQAIVRSTSQQQLFDWVCSGAVGMGGMRLAWIGLIDRQSNQVVVTASHGDGLDALQELHVRPGADTPYGAGPTGIAIREDRAYWCQHYRSDPITAPWHSVSERFGWAASAALPLHRNGQVIGTLNVYAENEAAFDPQVQSLLLEMTSDIDFALQNFDREAARLQADRRTIDSESRLALALKGSRDALWDWNMQDHQLYYSPRWWQMLGLEVDAYPIDAQLWRRFMHPQDLPDVEAMLRRFLKGTDDSFAAECRIQHKDGHYIPMLVRGFALRDAQGKVLRVSGTNMDLTERVTAQQIDAMRSFMLERLASDATLTNILSDFVLRLEVALNGMVGSILLLDTETSRWTLGAAPNLTAQYGQALDHLQQSLSGTTNGRALLAGQRVIVENMTTHPDFQNFSEMVRREGVVSCWIEPIRASNGTLLGMLTLYQRDPFPLSSHDERLVVMAASLTALAIDRKRAETQIQLVAKVFEEGTEVVMITDASKTLVRVNRAFTRVTGYTEQEALGRTPSMLASGKHDDNFYAAMWSAINAQGQWQGEVWNRRKDGTLYPEWLSINQLHDAQGNVTNYVAIGTDITARKADEERIRLLADYDTLTGLPNRRLLQDRIQNALSHAQRNGESLALMFLDLDRFKNVNDSLGHHVGDALLVQVAQRLKAALREQDTVCRLGGDEFVILCPDTDSTGAAHVASKLQEATSARFLLEQLELTSTFSIGIAVYPQDGDTFETLSMRADSAMYKVKQSGRNGFRFFTAEMQAQSDRVLQLENALGQALERNQLHLVYQPQVSLHTGEVVAVEALLRWNHPALGNVSPGEFIPVAEDSGLIIAIGEWVLRTAARQMRAWLSAGMALQQMAVNLSAVQFRQANLTELVTAILTEEGLPPHCLEVELTEGVAMNDPLGAIAIMNRLQQSGVRMSIDDFGTGYSSLNYLKRFNIYKLKIDQSFVRDITVDPEDKAIVSAIIGLARTLGFQTIAEGVETQGQLAFLRQQGCDEVQGYFFSRPLPADQFETFMRSHNPDVALELSALRPEIQAK
jgi:diguanylate cyclase (GGDEF)-like protein/PAS domain S-box-containing protein